VSAVAVVTEVADDVVVECKLVVDLTSVVEVGVVCELVVVVPCVVEVGTVTPVVH
jgi:hypothetical protein